jgi:hypothetical protein
MFKKIQNYLLLRHPLLWNIKFVPMLCATLLINLIFFIIGYCKGAIDFTEYDSHWRYDDTKFVIVFLGIVVSLLTLIIWLVYYFRNNAYKSYYQKSNVSLYKEWLLILMLCLLNCCYSPMFSYAHDLRARNYFTEDEFARRIEVIAKASIFVEGTFDPVEYENNDVRRPKKTKLFNGREYSLTSLINKNTTSYSYFDREKDSANAAGVKLWLVHNEKDSVYHLMKEFYAIAKEHKLKANITPEQWVNLIYNYPEFTDYFIIGENEYDAITLDNLKDIHIDSREVAEGENQDNIAVTTTYDKKSNIVKIKNGMKQLHPRYYVPFDRLDDSYGKISDAWDNPSMQSEGWLFVLYAGLALSLAIFSFRVTSGREWLIALVGGGVVAIVTGIITAFTISFGRIVAGEILYFTIWLAILLILLGYFISIYTKKTAKGFSGIALNVLLWLLPAVLPVVYAIILYIIDINIEYDKNHVRLYPETALEFWMENNIELSTFINVLITLIYMYFFTAAIKKWKGIAEA